MWLYKHDKHIPRLSYAFECSECGTVELPLASVAPPVTVNDAYGYPYNPNNGRRERVRQQVFKSWASTCDEMEALLDPASVLDNELCGRIKLSIHYTKLYQ